MRLSRSLALLTTLILAGSALAQDGTRIVRAAKVGAVQTFTVAAELEVMSMAIAFTATVTEKITAVEPDGTYTVESTQSNVKVSANGSEMPAGEAPPPSTSRYKATGELLETKGQNLVPDDVRRANMTMFISPAEPVKVGSKWSSEIKGTESSGGIGGKAEYEVVAEETVGQVRTFKIAFKYTESSGETPGSATGFVWVDLSDGSLFRLEANYVNAPLPQAGGPVNMKVTITRA